MFPVSLGARRRRTRALSTCAALTLAALILGGSAPVRATVIVPRTIEQMTHDAERVVRGRVLSSRAAWDQQRKRIYTTTEVEVLEQLQGSRDVPRTVSIRTLGGEVGEVGMRVSGTETFTPGEEIIVFLRRDPLTTSAFQVVGMSQGKYRIERDADGTAMAIPNTAGLAFARPDPAGVYRVEGETPRPDRIALDELKMRIAQGAMSTTTGRVLVPVPGPAAGAPAPAGVPAPAAPPTRAPEH